jgi:hypothetical protein
VSVDNDETVKQPPPEEPEQPERSLGEIVQFSLDPDDAEPSELMAYHERSLEMSVKFGIAREEQSSFRGVYVRVPTQLRPLFEILGEDAGCATSSHRQRAAVRYGFEVLINLPILGEVREARNILRETGKMGTGLAYVRHQWSVTHSLLTAQDEINLAVGNRSIQYAEELQTEIGFDTATSCLAALVCAVSKSEDAPVEVREACAEEVQDLTARLARIVASLTQALAWSKDSSWQIEPWKIRGDDREWVPHAEAAKIAGVTTRTLTRWIQRGWVESKQAGKSTLIRKDSLGRAKLKGAEVD